MKSKSTGGGGGGVSMNKNVKVGVRTGQPSKATSPAAAAQLGAATVFSKEQADGGGRAERNSVPLGNEVALNVKGGGPGTGREVHRSGSQGYYGPAAKGEVGMTGTADRGARAIQGAPPKGKTL
jgi:hypothetical protein